MPRYRYRTSKNLHVPSEHFYQHGDALLLLIILAVAFPIIPLLLLLRCVRLLPLIVPPIAPWIYGNLIFHSLMLVGAILILITYLYRYRNLLFLIYSYLFLLLLTPFFTPNGGFFELILILAIALATIVLYYRSYQLKNIFPHHFIFHFRMAKSSPHWFSKIQPPLTSILIFLYLALLLALAIYLLIL